MKTNKLFFSTISLLAFFALYGCGSKYKVGYVIDRKNNKVIWWTWDEGNGIQEKIVKGADIKTFELLKLKHDPYFKRNAFAKDKQFVYCEGDMIKNADPKSFRYENNIYRDDRQIFVFDSMLGFIPEKMATTVKTSEEVEETKYTPVFIEVRGKDYDIFDSKLKKVKIGDKSDKVIRIMGTPVIDKKITSGASKKRYLYYFLLQMKKNSFDKARDFYYKFEFNSKGILTGIYQKLPTAPRFLNDEKHHEKETRFK